jgi:glycoside/pentoside/hexuronide:cation symporter, GPH family
VALVGPILVVIPVWVRVSRRYDKRGAMIIASLLFMLGALAIVPTRWFGAVWAYPWVVVIGIGYAGVQLLQFSMMSDVIAADEIESGQRRAGVFTGLWTATETVVSALGALLLGVALEAFGFIATDPAHPVTQPGSAVLGVALGGALLPALLILFSLALVARYDLTATRFAELRGRTGAAEPDGGRPAPSAP